MISSSKTTFWLFTDLDGTLIPLEQNADNVRDLEQLATLIHKNNMPLVFVTGRHRESVQSAIGDYSLPEPRYLVCDVGTSIYERLTPAGAKNSSEDWRPMIGYFSCLEQLTEGCSRSQLQDQVLDEIKGIQLQEREKQAPFKLSFYCKSDHLSETESAINQLLERLSLPYSTIASVDPFCQQGLIDLLPAGVNKRFAVAWLCEKLNLEFNEQVIFAGDSGNDFALLRSSCHAVFVANGNRELARELSMIRTQEETISRLFLASRPSTSGVLEGVDYFLQRESQQGGQGDAF